MKEKGHQVPNIRNRVSEEVVVKPDNNAFPILGGIPDIVVYIFLEKLVLPPTYIRWLQGGDISWISHSNRIEFSISLIIQRHYISQL